MTYPPSLYANQIDLAKSSPRTLSPDEAADQSDVIVIGGGFAGLTTALELARAGTSVTLFEASDIGWGASGRNGGFVSDGFALGLGDLERKLGPDHAKNLWALSAKGTGFVRTTIADLDPAIMLGKGWISAYRYMSGGGAARMEKALARVGTPSRYVPHSQIRDLLKSRKYVEGVEITNAFHIQPLAYALGLGRLAADAGAHLVINCPATGLERAGSGWSVAAGGRTFAAPQVVLTGSAYMHGLYPALEGAMVPVATYVVASKPMAELLDQAIAYTGCISDTRRAGDYYRRLPDGRLVWGGRITTRTEQPDALSRMLRRDIVNVYPQLDRLEVEFSWSGLMGYAPHKMPIIGELEPGLWSATAFGGHGLNTSAMGGLLIAGAIAHGDDQWRQFAPFGARWAGGWLGRMATQGTYWLMQARDRLDELKRV